MRNLKGGEKGLIERTIAEALTERKKFSAQFKGPEDFLVAITEAPAQAKALLNVVLSDPFCFNAIFSKWGSIENIDIMKALGPELRQRLIQQLSTNPNQFMMVCGDLHISIIRYDNAFPDENNQFSRCVLSNSTLFSEYFNNEKGGKSKFRWEFGAFNLPDHTDNLVEMVLSTTNKFNAVIAHPYAFVVFVRGLPEKADRIIKTVLINTPCFDQIFGARSHPFLQQNFVDITALLPTQADKLIQHVLSRPVLFDRFFDNLPALLYAFEKLPNQADLFMEYFRANPNEFKKLFKKKADLVAAARFCPQYREFQANSVAEAVKILTDIKREPRPLAQAPNDNTDTQRPGSPGKFFDSSGNNNPSGDKGKSEEQDDRKHDKGGPTAL